MIELLSPAGTQAALKAAVNAGADAIYIGGKEFNARRNAENFTEEEILEGIRYAHLRGKKVYLTLNTLIKKTEVKELIRELKFIASAGFDAIILQDLGALEIIKKVIPSIPLHASTQMSAHSVSDCLALKNLGFKRVVLARELTLDEIKEITDKVDIETEVFIHGALCVSVSGQCYFSSALGERSANRGLCAQVCRLPFSPTKKEQYALSLKDLSYIDQLEFLKTARVSSFKIEGRMKRAEYVYQATDCARKALDGKSYSSELLENVFSRSGFTNSYLEGKDSGYFGTRRDEDKEKSKAVHKSISEKINEDNSKVLIDVLYSFTEDSNPTITITTLDGKVGFSEGSKLEHSQNKPLTEASLEKSLSKVGGTPYIVNSIRGNLDQGLFCSAKEINNMRREALEQIDSQILGKNEYRTNFSDFNLLPSPRLDNYTPYLVSSVSFAGQASEEMFEKSRYVAIPLFEIKNLDKNLLNEYKRNIIVELPRVYFESEESLRNALLDSKSLGLTNGKAHTIGRIKMLKDLGFEIHGGFGLNLLNDYAISLLEKEYGVKSLTLSPEILASQAKELNHSCHVNVLGYGYLPMMVTRVCPIKGIVGCKNCTSKVLKDRKGVEFDIVCNEKKTFEILNSQPLYIGDKQDKFVNINSFELMFKKESAEECKNIISQFQDEYEKRNITRGCYFRKIT